MPEARKAPRILLMDDDDAVARVLARVLQAIGYSVKSVPDGERALEAWREAKASGRPFSAAILDLSVARGLGGIETLARLKKLDPEARAIVSSGYSSDPILSEYRAHGFCGALPKPFRLKDVSTTLRAALGRPPRKGAAPGSCPEPPRCS
ncbi:MAG: response regulator [Elusimicrobiota bacterium]